MKLWTKTFGIALLVLLLFAWAQHRFGPGAVERRFAQVRPGMSEVEVDAIFGNRHRTIATSEGVDVLYMGVVSWDRQGARVVSVSFHPDIGVIKKELLYDRFFFFWTVESHDWTSGKPVIFSVAPENRHWQDR